MATQRIEIRPGFFIQVDDKHNKHGLRKKRAMQYRTDISASEREAIMQSLGDTKYAKYTVDQLDRAVTLSNKIGIAKAAKKTGVNIWSVIERRRFVRAHGGDAGRRLPGGPKPRYTMDQKRACVRIAQELINTGKFSLKAAFVQAGKRLGVNGWSIRYMNKMGLIK